jgi:hypothetical protein
MTLFEIKENLAKFQLVQCGLSHEMVHINPGSGIPEQIENTSELMYKRVSLCDRSLREFRLGCAHSNANLTFSRTIESLAETDPPTQHQMNEFDRVSVAIYMLDHRVGNLEKNRAEIEEELAECKLIHRGYINELKTIKSSIIARVDELINN